MNLNKKFNSKCPICGSTEFISNPNRYDIFNFIDGEFKIKSSNFVNDEDKVFCRECSTEVDIIKSDEFNKIIVR